MVLPSDRQMVPAIFSKFAHRDRSSEKCTVMLVLNPETKEGSSAHEPWEQSGGRSQRLDASGFSSLCPCLSAGRKQEASDDREGKELMSQRLGH